MRPAERLEELEAVVTELAEANRTKPILVEGQRDLAALRALGCRGLVLTVHSGEAIVQVADRIAARHDEVILLTDWDRKGGQLARLVQENLTGRVRFDLDLRRRLAKYAAVKDVESLPGYLRALAREAQPHAPRKP